MRIATKVGACQIDSLPGQSQIAICHSFFVSHGRRGLGEGGRLKKKQLKALYKANYDFALCTVAQGNCAQKKILKKQGWAMLTIFWNTRSSEITEIWGYEL